MTSQISLLLDEIPQPGAKGFSLVTADGEREGIVVRFEGEIRAYLNSCPHTGVTLNWSEDQFFDPDQQFIQCSLHGALFNPLDGRCIWGPCHGESLQCLSLELVDGNVIIYI